MISHLVHAVPYRFGELILWAVEDTDRYIYHYCNTKADAEKYINDYRKA